MDSSLRLVTRIPLNELWRSDGTVLRTRIRSLAERDLADLLSEGEVEFAVADLGKPIVWIAPIECFAFWKAEAKPHLAAPESRLSLEAFPGCYAYFASLWERTSVSRPIVLLERHH